MAEPGRSGLTVAPGERGVLRVFAMTASPAEVKALAEPGALQRVLGAERFDPAEAEVFAVADLAGMSLSDYLVEGYDIAQDQIAPLRPRLDALDDHVVVVRSRAFGGQAMTLLPSANLHLVASLAEPRTDWSGEPIETESVKPGSARRPSPREARNRARRIGGAIFVGFLLIVALILLLVL